MAGRDAASTRRVTKTEDIANVVVNESVVDE